MLSTQVAGGQGTTHTVEIIKGTFIHSVGQDTKPGQVVEISDKDYRFLKPYGFCKDYVAEDEVTESTETADEGETTDEVEDDSSDETEVETEGSATVESKRSKK